MGFGINPTMLGFRKDADQLRSDFDFLTVGNTLELCVLAELDELAHGATVLLKERIDAVFFHCWQCGHNFRLSRAGLGYLFRLRA